MFKYLFTAAVSAVALIGCSSMEVSDADAVAENFPEGFSDADYMAINPRVRYFQMLEYMQGDANYKIVGHNEAFRRSFWNSSDDTTMTEANAAKYDSIVAADTAEFWADTLTLQKLFVHPYIGGAWGYNASNWEIKDNDTTSVKVYPVGCLDALDADGNPIMSEQFTLTVVNSNGVESQQVIMADTLKDDGVIISNLLKDADGVVVVKDSVIDEVDFKVVYKRRTPSPQNPDTLITLKCSGVSSVPKALPSKTCGKIIGEATKFTLCRKDQKIITIKSKLIDALNGFLGDGECPANPEDIRKMKVDGSEGFVLSFDAKQIKAKGDASTIVLDSADAFEMGEISTLAISKVEVRKMLKKFNFEDRLDDDVAVDEIPLDQFAISYQYVLFGRNNGFPYRYCSESELGNPRRGTEECAVDFQYCDVDNPEDQMARDRCYETVYKECIVAPTTKLYCLDKDSGHILEVK